MSTIAFIVLRLSSPYPYYPQPEIFTRELLQNFVSDWALREKSVQSSALEATRTIRYLQYSLLVGEEQVKQDKTDSTRLLIMRDRGTFERAPKGIPASLQERRFSLALISDGNDRYPSFTVLAIADQENLVGPTNMVGIKMESALNPFHVFIRVFDDIVQYVCTSWMDVIKGLDQELSVEVNEIQSCGYMT
jgi:hypothetical protein